MTSTTTRTDAELLLALPSMSWADIIAKAPPGARAAIVAEYEVDQCDSMTDYFATRKETPVLLGFRRSSRESFPALRKAAARFAPTAHLGPGRGLHGAALVHAADDPANGVYAGNLAHNYGIECPSFELAELRDAWVLANPAPIGTEWRQRDEKVEHRDNWSMGAGNYLKAAGRYWTGWTVSSRPLTCRWSFSNDQPLRLALGPTGWTKPL